MRLDVLSAVVYTVTFRNSGCCATKVSAAPIRNDTILVVIILFIFSYFLACPSPYNKGPAPFTQIYRTQKKHNSLATVKRGIYKQTKSLSKTYSLDTALLFACPPELPTQ